MTRFLLIRHGQSEWNELGKWQGHADPPLTDFGRSQAVAAAAALGMVDAVVTSDLERATETAQIIADLIGVGPVITTQLLRERDAGEWEGMTRAQIEAAFPGWLADRRWPESFESSESAAHRAFAVLGKVAEEFPNGEVLVVTHGGVIVGIEEQLTGTLQRLFGNLGGVWIQFLPDGQFVMGDAVELLDESLRTGSRQL